MAATTSSHRKLKIALLAVYSAAALAFMGLTNALATGIPESVTGLNATAIDQASLGLSWNAAKDGDGSPVDHYRVYYGTTSVQTVGTGAYDTTVDTNNNAASYIVGGLLPNTTYYFALTALNAEDEESELYSQEASATTKGDAADGPAAEVVVDEEEGMDLLDLVSETDQGGEEPKGQEDTAGTENVVKEPEPTAEAPAGDATAPTVENAEAVTKTSVKVTFSEVVRLPAATPEIAFTITEQNNPLKELAVTKAAFYQADETSAPDERVVVLTTAEQALNVNYVLTVGVALVDVAGNPVVSGNQDSGLFMGTDRVDEEPADTTPPEDITNLLLSFKEQVDRFMVLLDWTASVNTARDLVDQILYMSLDRGVTYDKGQSLGAAATHTEKGGLEGGREYTFKITTKDDSGNESVGVVKSIRLPQTGAAVGLFLLGSVAAAGRILRRRRK